MKQSCKFYLRIVYFLIFDVFLSKIIKFFFQGNRCTKTSKDTEDPRIYTVRIFSYLCSLWSLTDMLLIQSHTVWDLQIKFHLIQLFEFHSGDQLSRLTFVVFLSSNTNHLLLNFRERNLDVEHS